MQDISLSVLVLYVVQVKRIRSNLPRMGLAAIAWDGSEGLEGPILLLATMRYWYCSPSATVSSTNSVPLTGSRLIFFQRPEWMPQRSTS